MGLLNRKKTQVDEPEKKIEETPLVDSVSSGKTTGNIKFSRLIIKPLVTEKAAVAQSQNKYSFMVNRRAGKLDVKRAIKEIFGVEPIAVNIMNIEGKIRRFGRATGRRSDYKKAVITLPKGKSISVHEGV
jgi:large subunit ribosomal protein L23